MAVLLEMHYDKDEILETYLNEIYLGQDRDRAIHGVGLAAQFYFGKEVQHLTLAESALLVGMVKGPAVYDPHRHAARALERRNLVLRETREQGSITLEQYAHGARDAPRRAAASRRWAPRPTRPSCSWCTGSCGATTTRRTCARRACASSPRSIRACRARPSARSRKRLAQFDKDKRFGQPGLEGAVVVTDPQSGEVQALVGGRDARYRGYNRALDAARPVGSLLKPAIYLTALPSRRDYTLVTPIDDGPFVWKSRGAPDWEPQNYDKKFHGMVPLRTALAQSYNAATARLGTDIGVEKVLDNVQRLGVERDARALRLDAARRGRAEPARSGADVPDPRERRLPHAAARHPRGHDAGGQAARSATRSPSSRRSRPSRSTSSPPRMQGVVREGTGQGLKSYLPAGDRRRRQDRHHRRAARRLVRRLHRRPPRRGLGRLRRQPRRAPLRLRFAALPVWGDLMAALAPEPLALAEARAASRTCWIDPQSGLRGDSELPGRASSCRSPAARRRAEPRALRAPSMRRQRSRQ